MPEVMQRIFSCSVLSPKIPIESRDGAMYGMNANPKKYLSYKFFIIIAYGDGGNKQGEGGSRASFRDCLKFYKWRPGFHPGAPSCGIAPFGLSFERLSKKCASCFVTDVNYQDFLTFVLNKHFHVATLDFIGNEL